MTDCHRPSSSLRRIKSQHLMLEGWLHGGRVAGNGRTPLVSAGLKLHNDAVFHIGFRLAGRAVERPRI